VADHYRSRGYNIRRNHDISIAFQGNRYLALMCPSLKLTNLNLFELPGRNRTPRVDTWHIMLSFTLLGHNEYENIDWSQPKHTSEYAMADYARCTILGTSSIYGTVKLLLNHPGFTGDSIT
jgi:hypothetical protein